MEYSISTQLALYKQFIIVSSDGADVLSPHTDTIIKPLLTHYMSHPCKKLVSNHSFTHTFYVALKARINIFFHFPYGKFESLPYFLIHQIKFSLNPRFFTAHDEASSATHIYKVNTDVANAPQRPLCVSCQIVPNCSLNNAVMSPESSHFIQVSK